MLNCYNNIRSNQIKSYLYNLSVSSHPPCLFLSYYSFNSFIRFSREHIIELINPISYTLQHASFMYIILVWFLNQARNPSCQVSNAPHWSNCFEDAHFLIVDNVILIEFKHMLHYFFIS
jgi:hypothetical protein